MVYRCDINHCTNSSNKSKGISYHGLPSDNEIRTKWLKTIEDHHGFRKSKKNYNCDNVFICSEHFQTDCYTTVNTRKRLVSHAIPSIFPSTNDLLPLAKKRKIDSSIVNENEMNVIPNIESTEVEPGSTQVNCVVSESSDGLNDATLTIMSDCHVMENNQTNKPSRGKNKRKYNKRVAQNVRTEKERKLKHTIQKQNISIRRLKMDSKRKAAKIVMLEKELQKFRNVSDSVIKNVSKLQKKEGEDDTYATIMMDQLRNYGKKEGARWSQLTIKNSIILNGRSSSTFKYLRKSKIINLPSANTLRAYTGKSTGTVGLTPLVEQRLKCEARRLNDIEKLGSLQVDEMTIKPKEKYSKNFGKYFGKVDMGGVVRDDTGRLANKVLGFVFTGLSTRFRIPVGVFMVNQLTADQQYKLTVHVMEKLETYGFRVIRLVTDNLSVNVKMFTLFNDGVPFPIVPHPIDEAAAALRWPCVFRPLFLSFDPCHVIKNVRNQLIDRTFAIEPGKIVSFDPIRKIFLNQQTNGLLVKQVRFLTRVHVNPNNLERQKVKPAIDIFRPEITAAITMNHENHVEGFEDIHATVQFLEIFHKWFSIHDVSNTTEAVEKRLDEKKPFISVDDQRLKWLEDEFLEYLDNWKEFVATRLKNLVASGKNSAKTKKDERLKFLTKETYEALRFTTLSSTASIKYLLELGFAFVLTRKFSSDDIEMFFGAVRQMMGGNFQGDAYNVITAFEKVLRTGIAYASMDSNVILHRETEREYELLRNEMNVYKRAKSVLELLPSEKLVILQDLQEPPGIPKYEVIEEVSTVAYLGGYCLFILKEWGICSDCLERLQQDRSSSPFFSYIHHLDRGGLLYPSEEFLFRLWTIYSFVKSVLPLIEGCSAIVQDLVAYLLPKVITCHTFECQLPLTNPKEEHKTELVECILKKFIIPLVRNRCRTEPNQIGVQVPTETTNGPQKTTPTSISNSTTLHVQSYSKNRRLRTLRQ